MQEQSYGCEEPRGSLTMGEVVARFKELLVGGARPLLSLWLVYAGVAMVFGLTLAALQYATGSVEANLVGAEWMLDPTRLMDPAYHQRLAEAQQATHPMGQLIVTLVSLFGSVLLLGVYGALMRPLRDVVQNRPLGAVGGEVLRVLPTCAIMCVVWFAGVFVGTLMCCIPGMAVSMLLYPMLYMAASRGSVSGGLRGVREMCKRQTGIVVALALLQMAFGTVVAVGSMGLQIVFLRSLGEAGIFVHQIFATSAFLAMGYLLWLFSGTAYAMIEEREGLGDGF